MNDIKYPDIRVQLDDGNAVSIIQRVRRALRRGGVPQEQVDEFTQEAKSGDYDNVIDTAMRWVDVE